MDATTGFDAGTEQASQVDPDALYAEFMARAKTLKPGAIAQADALKSGIVLSELSPATFKTLAQAIAKHAGLDADELRKTMHKARSKLGRNADDDDRSAPSIATLPDPPPSTSPEPLAAALDRIVRVVQLRVVCADEAAWAIALWTAATWGIRGPDETDGPDLFPRLMIWSATKRCGKSLLLQSVLYLSATPLAAENVTAASVFRVTEAIRPTWLLDEADTFLRKSEDLRGVMNSGYVRQGAVTRLLEVAGRGANGQSIKTWEPRSFSTFAPMAIAGIGRQSDTVEDRSVRIVLKRQLAPRARSQRLRHAELLKVRNVVCGCLHAHGDTMAAAMAARPVDDDYPDEVNDRDADNWQPLVAVAKLAGGEWTARVRRAMLTLCTGVDAEAQKSDAERLLSDIFDYTRIQRLAEASAFLKWRRAGRPKKNWPPATGARPSPADMAAGRSSRPTRYNFVPSVNLVDWLMNKDDSSVATARDDKAAKLLVAKMLGTFGIRPGSRWKDARTVRGYELGQFRPVWRSYRIGSAP